MSMGRLLGRLVVAGSVIFAMMGIAESPTEWIESRPVSAHESVDCGRCHLFVASTSDESYTLPNQQAECRSCHMAALSAQRTSTFPLAFHDNKERDCRDCHYFHKRDLLHTDSLTFSLGKNAPARDAVCAHCHQSGGISHLGIGLRPRLFTARGNHNWRRGHRLFVSRAIRNMAQVGWQVWEQ